MVRLETAFEWDSEAEAADNCPATANFKIQNSELRAIWGMLERFMAVRAHVASRKTKEH